MGRITRSIPAILVFLLITSLSIGFSIIRLTDVRGRRYNITIPGLIGYWLFAGTTLYCFFAVQFTNPGRIKSNNTITALLSSNKSRSIISAAPFPCIETKSDNCLRYCRTCKQYKPDRSHHDSVTNSCILKMDHYCIFVNNTIGYYNHKYFLLFGYYGSLGCCYSSINILLSDILNIIYSTSTRNSIIVLTVFIISTILAIVLSIFFLLHSYLLINNITTIEHIEKSGINQFTGSKYINKYNYSINNNIRSVMGKSIYQWFIPYISNQWRPNNNSNNYYTEYSSDYQLLIQNGIAFPIKYPHPQRGIFSIEANNDTDNDSTNDIVAKKKN